MANSRCYRPRDICGLPDSRPKTRCGTKRSNGEKASDSTPLAIDLSVDELRKQISQVGSSDEDVYAYVARSVRLDNGEYIQTGSAPNFHGGLITLCTCKHSMRAALTPEEWQRGVWVAGLTSWDLEFEKRQSLVYLMRVGEAYASQAEIIRAFRRSGRTETVKAKSSVKHELGDLMIPASSQVVGDHRFMPTAYIPPVIGHVHRRTAEDVGWQTDVNYVGPGGRQSAMLVGDQKFSFIWTRPSVRIRRPSPTRPYRKWTLTSMLDNLEAIQN